ncbi:MAG: N-formylglutamate amidohydrolase [Rhodospirillaceae bacterium]|jgi:N-formylglutamate amidohydrolase|nr:N-formylglutamate amidohydrolase [Rhodospirillaceae bacterium]MBT4042395.1 N-formylglutamate amidohydrolase [Rhodospirillaceae bacterium]MBT4688272.1 N-formylglutamate amidohydrolase [Rhodospirillaceae bacterium]MBT5079265.1 N-formylglutamate amidohydrolase [Rhodospirillaceae bacterium]MBT5522451.1 N-formylglutamate amidohydrolase [Rhodospirillaceae bacterium]
MTITDAETAPLPFDVIRPVKQSAPVIFASPHSGRHYPDDLMAATGLPELVLRRSADNFVEELFTAAPSHGAPLIHAAYGRAYLDLNREPWELDPRMFAEELPSHVNTTSLRVAGGLGTIPRLAADGRDIYTDHLDFTEVRQRLSRIYFPYHHCLARMIEDCQLTFGHCLLIDCHSMPSSSGLNLHSNPGLNNKANQAAAIGDRRADIVLGDRFGTACAPELIDCVHRTLSDLGLRVQRNNPYAGGFTTYHYGRPGTGVHALQIEINRRLYMDEQEVVRLPAIQRVQAAMTGVIAAVCNLPMTYFAAQDAAAE